MIWGFDDAILATMTDEKKGTADLFLEWYKEGTLHTRLAAKLRALGVDLSDEGMLEVMRRGKVDQPVNFLEHMNWLLEKMRGSIFKRIQCPPIIRTSSWAYGYDMHESMFPHEATRKAIRLALAISQLDAYPGEAASRARNAA
jgi:NAD+ synthase (glutamine-hydrolysing)